MRFDKTNTILIVVIFMCLLVGTVGLVIYKKKGGDKTDNKPDTPETVKKPDTPETVKKPDTPETVNKPDTPETVNKPDTPETVNKPDTPEDVESESPTVSTKGEPAKDNDGSSKNKEKGASPHVPENIVLDKDKEENNTTSLEEKKVNHLALPRDDTTEDKPRDNDVMQEEQQSITDKNKSEEQSNSGEVAKTK